MTAKGGRKDEDFTVYDECLVIHMHKELDHHSVKELRDKSDRMIQKQGIRNIIFDFQGVDFMDSSGIGMVMGRYKQVIFDGGKVAAVHVTPEVDRIFKISGLYQIIDKYTTTKEALQAF